MTQDDEPPIPATKHTSKHSFYDSEVREKGYIVSQNRSGENQAFPLMRLSAVILWLSEGREKTLSTEEISRLMGKGKTMAKNDSTGIHICIVEETDLVPTAAASFG